MITSRETNEQYRSFIYEPESFKPLVQLEGEGQQAEAYHYQLDHLGTPLALTKHSGQTVWQVRYRAYGNVWQKEVADLAAPIETPLRFQGQYWDAETGLHYNRHRYYQPDTGRFISPDPIGLAGGINNYQYAPNPIGWVDPLGLMNIPGECPPPKTAEADPIQPDRQGGPEEPPSVGQSTSSGIVNKGGRFADLDKAKLAGEVGHHMPQNAFNRSIDLSRSNGPAIGMTTEDHALTRTYAGKGKATMSQDAGLNARKRLAKDIYDLRFLFGTKYNKGSIEAIEYAKTLSEFQK